MFEELSSTNQEKLDLICNNLTSFHFVENANITLEANETKSKKRNYEDLDLSRSVFIAILSIFGSVVCCFVLICVCAYFAV